MFIKLFLAIAGPLTFAVFWLIAQYSFGRKKMANTGAICVAVWALVGAAISVRLVSLVMWAVSGHQSEGWDKSFDFAFYLGVSWLVGIIPFLIALSYFYKNDDAH